MKTLNVTFTDAEYRKLAQAKKKIKGKVSWHHFILRTLKVMKGGIKE
jgi:hypothetical protein